MSESCNPRHFSRLNRRGFLSVGALAGAGLTLPNLLRMEQARADLKDYKNFEGTAKSIIHIFLPGGLCIRSRSIRSRMLRSSIAAR